MCKQVRGLRREVQVGGKGKGKGRGGGDDRLFDSRRGFCGVWVQPIGLEGELLLTEGHSIVLVDKPKGKEHDCVG